MNRSDEAVRHVQSFDTKDLADAARDDLAATLTGMGTTDRFGVFVRYVPKRGWTVFLRDRQAQAS